MILETGTNCAFSRWKGADCRVVHRNRRVQVKSCICTRLAWIYRYYYTCCLQLLGIKCHLLPAALTFERSDSGDSSMWRSSELSISSSMPVIFPARLRCMAWMRGNRRSPAYGRKIQTEHFNSRKVAHFTICLWREADGMHVGKVSIYPASASVHAEGRQPTWWWSVAPVPGRRQRAAAQDAENSIIRNTGGTVSFLKRSQPYLLHGDLRLSVDMLLGVTYSCGILVLGHPPYRIGCYGRSGGGCPGTHGLGGCSSRVTDKPLHLNCRNDGAAFATQAIRDQRRHVFFKRERCPLVVRTPELAELRWKLLSDLPTRWLAVMRGSCEEGRMEPNIWGRGPEERMALCMFWKSEANREVYRQKSGFHPHPVHLKCVTHYSRCGRTPWVGQRGLGRSWAICPAAG